MSNFAEPVFRPASGSGIGGLSGAEDIADSRHMRDPFEQPTHRGSSFSDATRYFQGWIGSWSPGHAGSRVLPALPVRARSVVHARAHSPCKRCRHSRVALGAVFLSRFPAREWPSGLGGRELARTQPTCLGKSGAATRAIAGAATLGWHPECRCLPVWPTATHFARAPAESVATVQDGGSPPKPDRFSKALGSMFSSCTGSSYIS